MWSRRWRWIKRTYCRLGVPWRQAFAALVIAGIEGRIAWSFLRRADVRGYVRHWTQYAEQSLRGMSRWHDLIDWVGGYPFEYAKPEEVFAFFRARGFALEWMRTCGGGLGNNEFVFSRGMR